MLQEPVVECTFFIPIRRDANLSDSELHPPELWEWLDMELYRCFQGRTIAPGLYEGFYQDSQTQDRVTDQSRKFLVAVTPSHVDQLRSLLSAVCLLFQQKCIYLAVASQVEFIEAPDHGSS